MRQQFSRYSGRKARERRFGGGAYTASAVHFDDDQTYMERVGALTGVADSTTGLMSFWMLSASEPSVFQSNSRVRLFLGGTAYLGNEDGSSYSSLEFTQGLGGGAWHHMMFAWNTGFAPTSRVFQMYRDDVAVNLTKDQGGAGTFDIFYEDTNWLLNVSALSWDVADFYFAPGQYLDLSNAANRLKFRSAGGKPVNLGADGSTPTGTAPAIFFSGDAAGFATNKGTGGAFTVANGSLSNAATSPSD